MRRINSNLLVLGLVVGGAALIKERAVREPAMVRPMMEVKPVISKATDLLNSKASIRPQAEAVTDTSYEKELLYYQSLKKKTYLTPDEQARKSKLLNSADILQGQRGRLMRSPVTPHQALEQNAAIDMLFEALRFGDAETATTVLRDVVTDGQVEDEDLSQSTRENLAGVKAEVLFQWSALKPSESADLENLLPGPVSEKIWKNVVNAEQATFTQSAAINH